MAVINLQSVLLGRQTICGRAVAGMVHTNSDTITGQTPANLSYSRHLSSHREHLGCARHNPVGVNRADADQTALRAGRPAGLAGVPASFGSRSEPALGEACPRTLPLASLRAQAFLGSQAGFRSTSMWAKKLALAKRGWRMPATGMPTRRTRGEQLGGRTLGAKFCRGHASSR